MMDTLNIVILYLLWLRMVFANVETTDGDPITSVDLHTPVFKLYFYDQSNELFVGARNYVFKLSSDIEILESVKTNNFSENINCYPKQPDCTNTSIPNNDIHVLLMKKDQKPYNFLVACGSAYKGMCFIMKTSPLVGSLYGSPKNKLNYIASSKSTVAFFAEIPNVNTHVLYTGAQYDGRPLEFNIPAFSARVFTLKPQPVIALLSDRPDYVSKIELKAPYQTHQIRFLYGFEDTKFVYFLTIQSIGRLGDVETKLGRICKEDHQFFSYMEIPLVCNHRNVGYNLATSAFLESVAGRENGTRLYVTFAASQKGTDKADKTKGSVVCSYDFVTLLGAEFDKAIKSCLDGDVQAKLHAAFNGADRSCAKTKLNDVLNYCGSGENPYILGFVSVTENASIHFQDEILTAVTVMPTIKPGEIIGEILFLGSEDGTLMKVFTSKSKETTLLYKKSVSDSLIRPDPVFDSTKNNLYFATGNCVVKFPAGSCSIYTDCKTCLSSKDPLNCGWCGSKCARADECKGGSFSKYECPPEIKSFTPENGTISGGTEVTIIGTNFGQNTSAVGENGNLTVHIASVKCTVTLWLSDTVKCKTGSVLGPIEGPVELYALDLTQEGSYDINGKVTSLKHFAYQTPELLGLRPHFGPVSGGTTVTVYGRRLNIGASHRVILNGVNCSVTEVNQDGIVCLSGPNAVHSGNETAIYIDDQLMSKNFSFNYLSDPRLVTIDNSTLASIAKGGMNVTVIGHNLDHVSEPKMILRFFSPQKEEVAKLESKCVVKNNGTVMNCKTPKLPKHLNSHRRDATVQSLVSFDMDGSKDFKSIGPNKTHAITLLYFSNPKFKQESEIQEININEPVLTINGENLSNKYKVDIRLENEASEVKHCIVQDSTDTRMFCRVDLSDEDSLLANDWMVSVIVVDESEYIGKVRFIRGSGFSGTAIFFIVLFILALLIAVALLILKTRGLYPFVKKNINYSVAYRADGQYPPSSPFNRQGSQNEYIGTCAMRERNANDPLLNGAASQTFVAEETMALLASENILIAREYLSLGKIIGKGCFGTVYRGELMLPGKNEAIEVAVKTLHNTRTNGQNIDCESFLQEGLMMKDFKHENVLSLIGVCLEANQSPMVILPFMDNGDLLTYVRDEENVVTVKDLMLFGIQVAEGMSYLASCKFVHRDLAARNCMIDKNKVVKVADFGLARDIYERDYYSSDHMKTKLPVKWMSPESLEKGIYDTKTDVWSFGVLLWEIMTRGVTPYPQVDNWDILTYLKQGNRMLRPEYCPEMLYDIMLRCWNDNPKARPAFSMLVTDVRDVISKLEAKSGQQKVGLNVQYVNYPPSKYYNVSGAEGGETSGVTSV